MDTVERYYDESAEAEWGRLERHRVEYGITLRALAEYLPPVPARVADIGGGPGRYAIGLARQGYQVTLVDVSAESLALARRRAGEAGVGLESIVHADGRDLPALPDEGFDAVLLMGPLYHLVEREERLRAVCEAHRILRPGGCVFASFIGRYAPIQDAAVARPEHLAERPDDEAAILATGVYRRPEGGGFVDAWFAHPSEVQPLMAQGGFRIRALLACEPLVYAREERISAAPPELHERWLDLLYRLARDPSILGASGHLLYVGWKPGR